MKHEKAKEYRLFVNGKLNINYPYGYNLATGYIIENKFTKKPHIENIEVVK